MPMQPRHFEAVIFSVKAAVATVTAALSICISQPLVAVVIGWLCALVVGFLFDKLSNLPKLLKKANGANHDAPE